MTTHIRCYHIAMLKLLITLMHYIKLFIGHINAYLIEQHMNHFVNFSRNWKELEHFCYELVHDLFFV